MLGWGHSGMMMIFSFISPLIASVLYLVVMQKAGFRGAILGIAALPLASALVSRLLIGGGYYMGGGILGLAFLLPMVLSLVPLLVLAFVPWPPVGDTPRGGGS